MALVTAEFAWFASPGTTLEPDGRYRPNQGLQGLTVVQVRTRDRRGEEIGSPVRSVIKWIFAPFLPRSTGCEPVRSPFESTHVHRVDRTPRPVEFSTEAEFIQDQAVQLRPHAGPPPLSGTSVRGRSREAEDRWEPGPSPAGGRHEDDRGQDLTVPVSAPPTTLRPDGCFGHHPLKQLPQSVRHQTLNHRPGARLSRIQMR